LAVSLVCACKEAPPSVPTVADAPDASRRPDGVMIDPPAALPSSVVRASASGVVALREPPGGEAVREVVLAFVDAFTREELTALDALLLPDAVGLDTRASRPMLLAQWRARMAQLEYGRLIGLDVVRPEKIRHYEYDELGDRDDLPRPHDMRPGDVLVRAPVDVARIGPDKFFGDTLVFVLRRAEGRYRIAAFGESDATK
jgi:hypothetical protein